MVLVRLTYFVEQQGILSPVQAGFRPGRSTVDQVLLLSQSIADSFHQSKPGARTVLATVDFAKAFDSVWHSALLSKLLSLDLSLCVVEWILSLRSFRKSVSAIHTVVLSVSEKVFPRFSSWTSSLLLIYQRPSYFPPYIC